MTLLADVLKGFQGEYGKTKDASPLYQTNDKTPANWHEDVASDKIEEALIKLFSGTNTIKDHQDLHTLAESMGIEPSAMEERAYAMLQSFFSQGRYMKEGQDKTFDPDELSMGDKVELEHTDSKVIARRIALDHLTELADYYTRLKAMEKAGKTGDATKYQKVMVTLRDPDGSLVKFLEALASHANPGHSFTVIMDPDSDRQEEFGFDGDGAFYIDNVAAEGTEES